MKNIFRKAVQKVRNTTAKVFRIASQNPELILAGVVLATLSSSVIDIIRDSRKTADYSHKIDGGAALTALKHVQQAFENAYKNKDFDSQNRLKISTDIVTRDDADVLSELRLYNDATGMLNLGYEFFAGHRESEKIVPNPLTDKELFGPIGYDINHLVAAFWRLYGLLETSYAVGDYGRNGYLRLHARGLTENDLDILKRLDVIDGKTGAVRLYYWAEDTDA